MSLSSQSTSMILGKPISYSASRSEETARRAGSESTNKSISTISYSASTWKIAIQLQSAVGSLMYAMIGTRPDIAYAVGATSSYNANPGEMHWKAVKRIIRYLKGTKSLELQYGQKAKDIHGYSNADWAGSHCSLDNQIGIHGPCPSFKGGDMAKRTPRRDRIPSDKYPNPTTMR